MSVLLLCNVNKSCWLAEEDDRQCVCVCMCCAASPCEQTMDSSSVGAHFIFMALFQQKNAQQLVHMI